jgi:hypothetical protein
VTEFDRLRLQVRTLVKRVETLEAAVMPPPEAATSKASAKRRKRWVGPVPADIRNARVDAYWRRFELALELGLDPSARFFAAQHNLSASEVSRWLTSLPRGIKPGGAADVSIWRAVREDTRKYEAMLAKRLGSIRDSQSAPTFSLHNVTHERNREVAKHRGRSLAALPQTGR